MARLPRPGSDAGQWGGILNDFLAQAHNTDGSLRAGSVGTAQIKDNSVTVAKIASAGVANGVALLDSQGRVPLSQLPTDLQNESNRAWLITEHGVATSAQSNQGQEAAILAACQSLSALGGGILIVPMGVEILVTDTIRVSSNITLLLEPGSRIRKNNPENTLMFHVRGVKNFSIIGSGTIDFGPRTITPGISPVHSLRVSDSQNVRIDGLNFVNCGARVISLQATSGGTNSMVGCERVTISNCHFDEVKDIGIDIQTGSGSAPAKMVTIENNVFEAVKLITTTNDPDNITPWTAIYATKTPTITIKDNHILQSDDTAIMLGNDCDDFIVEGNRCHTKQVSLFLGAVTNGIVRGNRFTSTNDMGIHYYVKNSSVNDGVIIINDNLFVDCAKAAVMVEGGNEVIISSNIFKHCTWNADAYPQLPYKSTISFAMSPAGNPDAITVVNNQIIQGANTSATLYGIGLFNIATNVVVAGNQVIGDNYTNKYYYAGLNTMTWEVQTDTALTYTNKTLRLPYYDEMISKNPRAGSKCWHDTFGELYADGTNWRKSVDGTVAAV